ncbi:hypothetical protein YYG_00492 [Plasmodium vinckei petteri]|uniref:Uncharacterized protein n=1 Tax=Plasmodium vinckei petteri TaxID=138298 RepID=W7B8Y7_PLAVN|nr:hypothetical protein YYG_00492 [Plasmodium vinckei petteri]
MLNNLGLLKSNGLLSFNAHTHIYKKIKELYEDENFVVRENYSSIYICSYFKRLFMIKKYILQFIELLFKIKLEKNIYFNIIIVFM